MFALTLDFYYGTSRDKELRLTYCVKCPLDIISRESLKICLRLLTICYHEIVDSAVAAVSYDLCTFRLDVVARVMSDIIADLQVFKFCTMDLHQVIIFFIVNKISRKQYLLISFIN